MKNEQRYCIVHIPYEIDNKAKSAPMLRPRKMIEGFIQLGYNVDVVCGNSDERNSKIKLIKKAILNGKKYDFMYAESSTMPTILTDKSHFPNHPFMDFSFFKFVKKHGINIGLFYRDIYWRFPLYKSELPLYKYVIGILCYEYEIYNYNKFVEYLYFPTLGFKNYLKDRFLGNVAELPPACDLVDDIIGGEQFLFKHPLNILYVGGIGKLYNILELVKAVSKDLRFQLTICCRKNEWEREKDMYFEYMSENIHVVHKSNEELKILYETADICTLVFDTDEYRKITIPYKAFEYLGNIKPSITSKGTAISKFIVKNDIGWEVEYEENAIKKCLEDILSNPSIFDRKKKKCIQVAKENCWRCRAEKVKDDLV